MVTRCHHAIVHGAELDWIHANHAVGTGGDVAHFDVSFARLVVFVFIDDAALREDFFGYFPMIVLHFGENADWESVSRIDVILREQHRRLRRRPRDHHRAVKVVRTYLQKVGRTPEHVQRRR